MNFIASLGILISQFGNSAKLKHVHTTTGAMCSSSSLSKYVSLFRNHRITEFQNLKARRRIQMSENRSSRARLDSERLPNITESTELGGRKK